jgi:hypothetical protein
MTRKPCDLIFFFTLEIGEVNQKNNKLAKPTTRKLVVLFCIYFSFTAGVRRSVTTAATIVGPLWVGASNNMTIICGLLVGLTAATLLLVMLAYPRLRMPSGARMQSTHNFQSQPHF